jgi:hypothetical protein
MRIAGFVVAALLAFAIISSAETYVVANFPYGGGWGSKLLISNSSANTVNVEIDYFTANGNRALFPVDSGATNITNTFVPQNATASVTSDPAQRFGTNPVVFDWAIVTTNNGNSGQPVNVFALYDFAPDSTAATQIGSSVGAAAMMPGQSFRFPIVVNGTTRFTASMAIANPSVMSTAHITLKLLDNTGAVKATSTLSAPNLIPNGLLPRTQIAVNLPGIPEFASILTGNALFTGSVGVCSDVPIGFVALGVEQSTPSNKINVLYSVSVTTDFVCS